MSEDRPAPVLQIADLVIRFTGAEGQPAVVDRASLEIESGEIHGLVGESGSGKTLLARAILDLLPPGAEVAGGSIRFKGQELVGLEGYAMRRLRGIDIGMVFQEPMMSLNPAMKIGRQMTEAMRLHLNLSEAEMRARAVEMLERVRMPNAAGCLASFPHEFSGGMRQRIMLASVLMLRPALLIADEPTTALDVLIQRDVLEIMLEVVRDLGTAVLLITHDLGLVARYARLVTVMERGVAVEQGEIGQVLAAPSHDYTRRLLEALPQRGPAAGEQARTDVFVSVRDLRVSFRKGTRLPWRQPEEFHAVDGVSLDIRRNETLAVVGESGSGKTTLGRAILGLVGKSSGSVEIDGIQFEDLKGRARRDLRRRAQIIFQDPYSSLDPRMRIGQIVGEGLRHTRGLAAERRRSMVAETLDEVGIDPAWSSRYPHELSGGQRQRIGIARAIITRPEVVVADEAVSALDLTVQAQILKLLKRLQHKIGFSFLFITHDLGVVEQIADRVAVMHRGRIVEIGRRNDLLDRPRHPYTCALLSAVSELAADDRNGYQLKVRNVIAPDPPPGFAHDTRYLGDSAGRSRLHEVSTGHLVAYTYLPE